MSPDRGDRRHTDPRPRVLHVLHGLARAGAERVVCKMALATRDQTVSAVACLDELGPLADELRGSGVPVFYTARRPGIDYRQVLRLISIVRDYRPDVLHCHQYTPFFYGTWASLWAGHCRVLFTEHGRSYPDRVGRLRRMVNRHLAAPARVTAVCEFARRRLASHDGIPASRIEVVYNGIDPEATAGRLDRGSARRRLGLDNEATVIVQVGGFRPVKDQETAVRAMRRVRNAHHHTVLLLIGAGPELPRCQALAEQLALGPALRFLGERTDVPEILAAADVALATSRSEAHSLALLEAMAAGLPVVATNVGGIPETVVHGQTGLLAPAGDDRALADAIILLLRRPDQRRAMGQAGRQRVRARFDLRTTHQRYLEIYTELAHGGRR